jgi:hypothetical protein
MGITSYITDPNEVADWAIDKLKLMRAEWGKIGMTSNPETLNGINASITHEAMATYAAIQGATQNAELLEIVERLEKEGFSISLIPFYPLGFPIRDFVISGPVSIMLDSTVHVHLALCLTKDKGR